MATQLCDDVKISDWTVGAQLKNTHGGVFWPILATKDAKSSPKIQIGDPKTKLRCPFGLSSFGDTGGTATRLSLDMSVSDVKIQQFLSKIDRWILDHLWNRRTEFFGKTAGIEALPASRR